MVKELEPFMLGLVLVVAVTYGLATTCNFIRGESYEESKYLMVIGIILLAVILFIALRNDIFGFNWLKFGV